MLYLYDNAIVDDLNKSFNPNNAPTGKVKVLNPEQSLGVVSQLMEDQIKLPLVCLERNEQSFDNKRHNFTVEQVGVAAFLDTETNNVYSERAIPVNLSYKLTILTSNVYDMDEMIREILFKYVSMYFLEIKVPYEGNREISFGVVYDSDAGIDQISGPSQYIESGQLYQSSIILRCEGCVLLHYTPHHLKRGVIKVTPD